MFKKLALSGLCLLLLMGCDSTEITEAGKAGASADNQAVQQENETAIYFPGGAGIDFGRKPIRDQVRKNAKGKEYRIVHYEFSEPHDVIDASVAEVLGSEKYKRKVYPDEKADLKVIYRKPAVGSIVLKYNTSVREGFEKVTRLVVWWLI